VRANVPIAVGADGRVDLDRGIEDGFPRVREAGATIAAFPIAAYVRRREDLPALLTRLASRAQRTASARLFAVEGHRPSA